ncbi:MAG: hypothetical protein M3092_03800 [Actinomycetia bacterium]|nr:hypothetical protein [Actinomycetes bacterium]
MTTITTGTSGPQAWKMILAGAAVGLATIAIVNLPQTTSDTAGQQATDASQAVTADSPQTRSFFDENSATGRTPALPESVTGFEYNSESTVGQSVRPGATSQYFGNSGELMPYENGTAPAQAPTGFGGPMPRTVPDQARIDLLAPVITQQFLDGPTSVTQGATRVDPRAAAAAGLNPGAIDAVVGGTTRVAPTPDNIADAQVRAEAAQVVSRESVGVAVEATNARWEALAEAYSEAANDGTASGLYTGDPDPVVSMPANANAEAGTDARWGALHGAYHSGTLEGYAVRSDDVSSEPNPADKKFFEAQAAAPQTQQRPPMTNNKPL